MWMTMMDLKKAVENLEKKKEQLFQTIIQEGWSVRVRFGISTIITFKKKDREIKIALFCRFDERLIEISMNDSGFERIGATLQEVVHNENGVDLLKSYHKEDIHEDSLKILFEWLREEKVDGLIKMTRIGNLLEDTFFGDEETKYVGLGEEGEKIVSFMNEFSVRSTHHEHYFVLEERSPYYVAMPMITWKFYPTPRLEVAMVNADFYQERRYYPYFTIASISSSEEILSFKEELVLLQEEQKKEQLRICESMNRFIPNYLEVKKNRIIVGEDPSEHYGLHACFTFNEPRFQVLTPLREKTVSTKEEGRNIILRDCKQLYRLKRVMKSVSKKLERAGLQETSCELRRNRYKAEWVSGNQTFGIQIEVEEEKGQFFYQGKIMFSNRSKTVYMWTSLGDVAEEVTREVVNYYRTHRLTNLFQ